MNSWVKGLKSFMEKEAKQSIPSDVKNKIEEIVYEYEKTKNVYLIPSIANLVFRYFYSTVRNSEFNIVEKYHKTINFLPRQKALYFSFSHKDVKKSSVIVIKHSEVDGRPISASIIKKFFARLMKALQKKKISTTYDDITIVIIGRRFTADSRETAHELSRKYGVFIFLAEPKDISSVFEEYAKYLYRRATGFINNVSKKMSMDEIKNLTVYKLYLAFSSLAKAICSSVVDSIDSKEEYRDIEELFDAEILT